MRQVRRQRATRGGNMGSANPRQVNAKYGTGNALPEMFSRYKDRMEQELSRSVPESKDDDLYGLLQYHLSWVDQHGAPVEVPTSQGKALRPTLCLFACEALSGDPLRAMHAAAAIELIHNFSLIHDDIQDQDLERRHRPTVWSVWGIPKALVAGDGMQALGDLAALHSLQGLPSETSLKVSSLLTESYLEMIEGQCLDLTFESSTSVAADDYLQMIAFKTGALIRNALAIGALLGGGSPTTTEAFAQFGAGLGRAFQIRDDFLGIWGDGGTTGKSTDSDIRRRKKSFPIVFALEHASGGAREDLLRIYQQDDLDDEDVERVLAVLNEVGADEESERLTWDSAQQAMQALEGIDLPAWARADAEELVDFLATRDF